MIATIGAGTVAVDTIGTICQWKDRLRVTGKEWGYGHFKSEVEIMFGNPSDDVLILCANDWQVAYFGGSVEYTYTHEDDGGQKHRYALVKVYTD
jgi:hypothetical protein